MASDVLGYLNSKGLHVRRGSGDEVHVPCMFHGEDPQERGRLYVNVNPAADIPGLFHCKVCGEKGSLVTLKRHFGDDEKITKVDEDSAVRRQILASAAAFYADNLVEHPEAVKWLKGPERGLTVHTLRDYQIGYAEGGLFFHLRNEGFDTGDIMATGLVVEDRTTKKPTDFFKRQITIPYTTAGNVVMIRGRTWPYDGDGPKYLTPPGQTTRLFNSDTIWSDTDPAHVLVTEGEFDCLVLQQLGFTAVGVPGAQIWQDAWDGYVSGVRRLYTIFDRDKAGEEGTRKLRDRFGPKVRPVHLSAEGVKTDPTAWVADGGTAEQLNDLLESAERRGSLLVGVTEARNAHAELAAMSGVKFGSEMLDLLIDPGLLPTQVMVVLAKTGTGKSLAEFELVATPTGWTKIRDIVPGDQVFGPDGQPATVTGVFPQGLRDLYEVRFSDGATVTCDREHLWQYRTNNDKTWRVGTLGEIMEHRTRIYIPVTEPVAYPTRDLPLDPYTMGVLIGDGYFRATSPCLACADQQIMDNLDLLGMGLRYTGCGVDYRISGVNDGTRNPVTSALRKVGLWGRKSCDRFIPDAYRFASVEQRVALLRGLMDTDGTIDGNGSCEYSTSSPLLAEHVAELVRSLGGVTGWTGRGIRRKETTHLPSYRITVRVPFCPFMLDRKAARWKRPKSITRTIRTIEPVGSGQAVCIKVDRDDGLFLIRDYVVTHNTIWLLNMMQRMRMVAGQEDLKFLFVSLEQTAGEWWERAKRIHRFYNLEATDDDCADWWADNIQIVEQNRVTELELHSALDDFEYRVGQPPDVVMIDYLGYWAQSYKGERYQRTSDAIMAMKAIAKDRRIRVISPHQVSRVAKDGEDFGGDAARDAGVVEETADFLFAIWNPDNTLGRAEEDRSGIVNLRIAKSRHGGRGQKIMFQWAPISLALVPHGSGETQHLMMARNELEFEQNRDNWEQAIYRHQTGIVKGVIPRHPTRQQELA